MRLRSSEIDVADSLEAIHDLYEARHWTDGLPIIPPSRDRVQTMITAIRREPDELIIRIVSGWSERFDAKRARELGFKAETSFDDIIRTHIEDELGGKIAA